jgi:hypothetical protein
MLAKTPSGDIVDVLVMDDPELAGMVPMVELDRRLWLTDDKSKVVEDGDPDSAFLYGDKGTLKPEPEAEKLGATKPAPKQAKKPADKSATKEEDK